ncbi:MAG: hypothetical protein Q8P38_00765 [Candidatus Nanopelagicales bacterium]|nr:hypothetical protein [Candidatus Nanopelagicales bacterium]
MRDDEIRGHLSDLNPWWKAAAGQGDPTAWAESDRLLRGRSILDVGYRARVLDDLATGPIGECVLKGEWLRCRRS